MPHSEAADGADGCGPVRFAENGAAGYQHIGARFDAERGGFGYSCKDIITRLGHAYSVKFSRFLESPLEGLVEYHAL